jgi:putative heme-binding domain-containing protein
VIFGDEEAIKSLRAKVLNAKAPEADRRRALAVLVEKKPQGLANDLKLLLDDNALRIDALRGMAVFGGVEIPQLVLTRYAKLKEPEKREAIQLLVSRPAYAEALLEAMAAGVVPRAEISVFAARQILGFGDQKLNLRLKELWGEIRRPAKDKKPLFSKYRKLLSLKNLRKADLSNGRLVYTRTCATCHKLFGEGGQIGPDLTGSDRGTLDYLLENILDPNAAIAKDFQLNVVTTKNGRAVSGIIAGENDNSLSVQTLTELVVVSKEDLATRQTLPLSMMPEGIFEALKNEDARDLVGYLSTTKQVPLPKKKK